MKLLWSVFGGVKINKRQQNERKSSVLWAKAAKKPSTFEEYLLKNPPKLKGVPPGESTRIFSIICNRLISEISYLNPGVK